MRSMIAEQRLAPSFGVALIGRRFHARPQPVHQVIRLRKAQFASKHNEWVPAATIERMAGQEDVGHFGLVQHITRRSPHQPNHDDGVLALPVRTRRQSFAHLAPACSQPPAARRG